jgi:hypothetical protein
MRLKLRHLHLLGLSVFFLLYIPFLHSPFYTPKIISLFFGAITFSLMFFFKKSCTFPSWKVLSWFLTGLLLMGLSLFSSSNIYDSIFQIALFSSSFCIFIGFLNLDTDSPLFEDIKPIPFTLFFVGVLQGFIAICQFIINNFMNESEPLVKSIGLIGNAEFLATFLGVSFFMGLSLTPLTKLTDGSIVVNSFFTKKTALVSSKTEWSAFSIWTGLTIIFLGILTTLNKGTLLFIFAYAIFTLAKEQKWLEIAISFMLFLIGMVTFWPYFVLSLQSRLFLWIVSGWMILNRPLTGVGIGQFGNHYSDMVFDLFQRFPFLSTLFGSFSNMVSHAHQLFLHFGSELGVLGLVWVFVLVVYTLRHILNDNKYYAAALFLLLVKSFYTVVFSSVTGAVLWAVLLAEVVKLSPMRNHSFTSYSKTLIVSAIVALAGFSLNLSVSDYYYFKGRKSLSLHHLVQAEGHFKSALKKHPGHANSTLSLAYIAYLQGNISKMDSYLSGPHHLYQDLNAVLLESDMRFYLRQYDKAKPLLDYIVVAYPERMGPRIKLALVELQLGNNVRARELADSVKSLRPRIKNPVHETYKELADSLQFLDE